MKKTIGIIFLLIILGVACGIVLAVSDKNDVAGSKDHPLFNRMPGYFIETYDEKVFDSVKMPAGPNEKTVTVEGRCTRIQYRANDYDKRASVAQVLRNFANAIQNIGGTLIYQNQEDRHETFKIVKNGSEIWVLVETGDAWYRLIIVEKQAMKQDVVANAAALANGLKETGKVTLYGIYFDTGKADIKPESEPTMKEIIKLLQANPQLKLYIVGHTDSVGPLDSNMKLSKDRADSVVKALVGKYGIAAGRLQGFGVGPLCPVASNQSEAGRAKNRRVELVSQ